MAAVVVVGARDWGKSFQKSPAVLPASQTHKSGFGQKQSVAKMRVKPGRSVSNLADTNIDQEEIFNNGEGGPKPYDDEEDHLFVFPPESYRKADHELGVLMSGYVTKAFGATRCLMNNSMSVD